MADTPETQERARRIGKAFTHESLYPSHCPHCKATLFVRAGKCMECQGRVTPPPAQRVVFDGWPLKRLHVRRAITDSQFEAGRRYYEHWYLSGLTPIGSSDMSGVNHRGDPCYGMAATERQAYHRQMFRKGGDALGHDFLRYVDAIVLHERTPEEVGKRHSGYNDGRQAGAVAMGFLRAGLDRLAKAFGLGSK